MKLHDRGTKKWTSLMMPEHVEMLKDVFVENKEMPDVDEHQISENNLLLEEALHNDLEVQIKYYANNDHKVINGNILYIDGMNKMIFLEDEEIEMKYIIEVNIL